MTDFLALEELTAAHLNAHLPLFVRKTSDETVNNATLQDDSQLTLAMEASTVYEMRLRAIVNSGTTPDIKFGWTYPAGTTMSVHIFEGTSPTSAATVLQGPFIQTDTLAFSTTGSDQIIIVEGLVIVSTTAGNLVTRWAQNAATGSDTTVKTNSYLRLTPVG